MHTFLNILVKLLFGQFEEGDVLITSSVSNLHVKLNFHPKEVYINIEGNHGHDACGSSDDYFNVKTTHDGFIINSKIKSSFRKISWIAIR